MMFTRQPLVRKGSIEILDKSVSGSNVTLVLFHGYGADAYDLSPLSDEIGIAELGWIFPQGPLKVPIGPGWMGRAWFSLDIDAIARGTVDHSAESVARLDSIRQQLLTMISALKVPSENLILGGFSQGAMVALDLALHMDTAPKALVILSGTLFDEEFLRAEGARLSGIRYFQSHGVNDPILPYSGAEKLHSVLEELKWDGYLLEFGGAHEIPFNVIKELKSFLQSLVR